MMIEVKEDFTCQKTGNVGLEFETRGIPSGINVTQATHYIFRIHEPNGKTTDWIVKVSKIKEMIKKIEYDRIIIGGDAGSNSKNYLFELKTIKKNAYRL
jgi:hypothetical protein